MQSTRTNDMGAALLLAAALLRVAAAGGAYAGMAIIALESSPAQAKLARPEASGGPPAYTHSPPPVVAVCLRCTDDFETFQMRRGNGATTTNQGVSARIF